MEKHKLIQKTFGICICSILTVLAFYIYQPSVYSKTVKHTLKLQPKESFEVRNGRIIYNEHCAPCHGVTGKGNGNYYASGLKPKPRDFTGPKFMKQVKDEYLIEVITKGTAAFGKSPFMDFATFSSAPVCSLWSYFSPSAIFSNLSALP